jgi:hypothetical protein
MGLNQASNADMTCADMVQKVPNYGTPLVRYCLSIWNIINLL